MWKGTTFAVHRQGSLTPTREVGGQRIGERGPPSMAADEERIQRDHLLPDLPNAKAYPIHYRIEGKSVFHGPLGIQQTVSVESHGPDASPRSMPSAHVCGFQTIPITHSIPFRSLIPRDSDHSFHGNSISDPG